MLTYPTPVGGGILLGTKLQVLYKETRQLIHLFLEQDV